MKISRRNPCSPFLVSVIALTVIKQRDNVLYNVLNKEHYMQKIQNNEIPWEFPVPCDRTSADVQQRDWSDWSRDDTHVES